jgi:hypothetical protein
MKKHILFIVILLTVAGMAESQNPQQNSQQNPQRFPQMGKRPKQTGSVNLDSLRWRDICIVPDPATKTYYIVGPGGRGVRCYTSKDLKTWEGPQMIYTAPPDVWGTIPIVSIWAPEMHIYRGKYYLFMTLHAINFVNSGPTGNVTVVLHADHRYLSAMLLQVPSNPLPTIQPCRLI